MHWSRADELAFEAEGERLLEIVRRDLGEGWEVTLYREPEASAAD
jgi:hypothetical protein